MKLWNLLQKWSATAFLIAGVVLVVYAALLGYQAFIDSSVNFHASEAAVVGPAGFAVGFIGLLGLYPTLADRSPKLARAGAVFAALAVAGWFMIAVDGLANLAGINWPTWLAAVAILGILGMFLGYAAFGVASLRTDAHSRTLGLLLLAPTILFGVLIVGQAITGGTAIGAALISSGLALSHLGIGYVLRTEDVPTEREEVER